MREVAREGVRGEHELRYDLGKASCHIKVSCVESMLFMHAASLLGRSGVCLVISMLLYGVL